MTGSFQDVREKWIDISVPLRSGMVHWPGDPEPLFERVSDLEAGAVATVTFCRLSAHTGTHMDAPCHFLAGQSGMEQFPIEYGIGRARVIAIPDSCHVIQRRDLEGENLQRGSRVLLKTRNSARRWDDIDFQVDYVAMDRSAAQLLAEAGVALVGVDYLSVGMFEGDGAETHRTLMEGGTWILEGINLAGVNEGEYELVCLPLRIPGADGAPTRAVIRPLRVAGDSQGQFPGELK